MKRVVVLVSGRGSNLRALLAAQLPVQLCAVISNDPAAPALDAARDAGVPAEAIDHHAFTQRADFDAALLARVEAHQPDLVVLAGFMRVLGADFVRRLEGRLINIHPSLLPAFPGLHTHRRALAGGVRLHGCTVHFVTAELDAGPIIVQAAVPVRPDDDEAALAARVLAQEHRILPQAVRWLASGAARLEAGQVRVDASVSFAGALTSPQLP